jgi:hypothetical protein
MLYFRFLEKVVLTKNWAKQVKWNQIIKKFLKICVTEGISVSSSLLSEEWEFWKSETNPL